MYTYTSSYATKSKQTRLNLTLTIHNYVVVSVNQHLALQYIISLTTPTGMENLVI